MKCYQTPAHALLSLLAFFILVFSLGLIPVTLLIVFKRLKVLLMLIDYTNYVFLKFHRLGMLCCTCMTLLHRDINYLPSGGQV